MLTTEQRDKFKLWLKKFSLEELNELRKLFWEEWIARFKAMDKHIKPPF
jgi:hypothetical protein